MMKSTNSKTEITISKEELIRKRNRIIEAFSKADTVLSDNDVCYFSLFGKLVDIDNVVGSLPIDHMRVFKVGKQYSETEMDFFYFTYLGIANAVIENNILEIEDCNENMNEFNFFKHTKLKI